MKLTLDEVKDFYVKKGYLLQSLADISLSLGVEEIALFLTVNFSESHPEVVQAVREWIA